MPANLAGIFIEWYLLGFETVLVSNHSICETHGGNWHCQKNLSARKFLQCLSLLKQGSVWPDENERGRGAVGSLFVQLLGAVSVFEMTYLALWKVLQ